jgi:glycosyltransferase involved in cell wall biosynthesis
MSVSQAEFTTSGTKHCARRTLAVNALRLAGKRTAMGRHIEILAQEWSRKKVPFDKVVLYTPDHCEIENLGSVTEIEIRQAGSGVHRALWEQLYLPYAARDAAALFCPAYTCPVLYPGRIVVANHGIYEAIPSEFSLLERLRATPVNKASARRADHVIANSLSTKGDLIKFFGVPESRLSVILPAANELCFKKLSKDEIEAEVRNVFGSVVPYVIFVGKLAKRRNLPNLIEAFAKVRQDYSLPHKLLIIGPNTGKVPIEDSIAKAGGAQVVLHLPHMEMEPLSRLYAGADLYVLPTTYEGISQTMFEAMASGTPVLSVDHPTLAEGGGDAVMVLPTPSVDDLYGGLLALLTNPALREQYARKGKERAALFSWHNTAERTMEILARVALTANK